MTPESVRELDGPQAAELARMTEVFDDLQTVLRCCERLVSELGADEPDDLTVEALWTTGVLAYDRCFGGEHALDEDDVEGTELPGDVLEWHRMLRRMREHYAHAWRNPRERCSVGVMQGEGGHASGVAVTSSQQPELDEVTVRQTGAIAYRLADLVDRRIKQRQESLRATVGEMAVMELQRLPEIELVSAQ